MAWVGGCHSPPRCSRAKTGIRHHPYREPRPTRMATLAPRAPVSLRPLVTGSQSPGHPFHYLVHARGLSSPSTSCPPGASADKVPAPSRGNKQQNPSSVGQPSYHRPTGCQGKLIMRASSSVSRTWGLQRQREKGTLKNTVGATWDFSGTWGQGGVGSACGKSRRLWESSTLPVRGQAGPWMEESWNLVPYLVLKRAGPALRKACICFPCLDAINQNRPPCLQSGWSTALYPPASLLSAQQSRGPKTLSRSPSPRCDGSCSHPLWEEKKISLASAQSCKGPTACSQVQMPLLSRSQTSLREALPQIQRQRGGFRQCQCQRLNRCLTCRSKLEQMAEPFIHSFHSFF